jgi:thiol-disulfide isomerase/thioredoxin
MAFTLNAQTIAGNFKKLPNSEMILMGYNGFTEKALAKTVTDSTGHFKLDYPVDYQGAALLQVKGASSVILLLHHENISMQWDDLQDFKTLKFSNSLENEAFARAMLINQEAEQKLAGLRYLMPLYQNQRTTGKWFRKEIQLQEQMLPNFINSLPHNRYAKEYIQIRKFLGDMQLTHDQYKELQRVKQLENEFRKIDFSNEALWHSGLVKEILNSYYQLLKNYGDEALITENSIEANKVWLAALEKQPAKLQEVAEFCFKILEAGNLTKASEHIALAMLDQTDCQLTAKQSNLFEQYRKLALGNTAPDIIFKLKNEQNTKSLKDLGNQYKLVVFGASWCPNCQTDYPSLIGTYKRLKETTDIEVVYISIDTDKNSFENYYKDAPFITYCDTKGWETQAAVAYNVFATPTYFLVDENLKIIAKPKSPMEIEEIIKQIESH